MENNFHCARQYLVGLLPSPSSTLGLKLALWLGKSLHTGQLVPQITLPDMSKKEFYGMVRMATAWGGFLPMMHPVFCQNHAQEAQIYKQIRKIASQHLTQPLRLSWQLSYNEQFLWLAPDGKQAQDISTIRQLFEDMIQEQLVPYSNLDYCNQTLISCAYNNNPQQWSQLCQFAQEFFDTPTLSEEYIFDGLYLLEYQKLQEFSYVRLVTRIQIGDC